MKAIQYTIRNIPEPVDRYLRKMADLRGQSLNQVIIDELSAKAGKPGQALLESLDWFIGKGNLGQDVDGAITEHRRQQRALAKHEDHKIDAIMKDINGATPRH